MTQPPEYPPPSEPSDGSAAPPPPPPPPALDQQPEYPAYPTGQWGQPGQYGQQPYYQGEQPGGTNGFAITALVLGFFCWPLGFIFGFVALSQIKKKNQKGRGLAIAGIVLSSLSLMASIALLATGGLDDADRDDKGALTEKGDVSTLELRDGDCLNGINEGTTMARVEGVPCSTPHEAEVYAVIELADGDFPGDKAVTKQADEQCPGRLESEHPAAWKDTQVGVSFFVPTSQSWRLDDHVITCLAVTEAKRTGSLAG